jgi:hypothetical protein
VPLPRLIPQVINKLEHEKCKDTLIVPEWTSAPFWPMVVKKDGHFRKCIIAHKCFQGNILVKRGRGQNAGKYCIDGLILMNIHTVMVDIDE